MGNSSSKDSRGAPGHSGGAGDGYDQASASTSSHNPQHADRLISQVYSSRNASGRLSRHDLAFLHIGRDRDADGPATERPRETKQEREARRAERERQARLKERERSMREESVDGGYLVTLGTYTGPEDFSKSIVRQLQIERRIAPFWKGLNDHSDSWTEAQLVAAARGLPIPAADEVPPDMARTGSQASSIPSTEAVVQGLSIPINSRSESYQTEGSANLSASHPAFASTSNSNPSSPTATSHATPPLLRGRAKTLASLAAGHKSQSPDLTPQEIRLPKDPYVNGTLIEAVLYKDAEECPICFLYYPPYLNRTRCCDQPICSECFVQIKRPDPHPPEHEQPGQERPPEEEAELLVSEVAACPFCVTPEFGVTFDPPPFRRGLVYANHTPGSPFRNPISATSSTTSLTSGATRRRATSLSANAPQVITTDRVRPDWAKKLADARAHVLRRSAAATALHNAAYMLGGQGDGQLRAGFNFNRRRRTLIVDSADGSGASTTREGDGSGDLFANRSSSRRNRVEDLEELMMMEAIRLSIVAEEERKRKETKETAKKAKKEAKEAKKEEKRAEKLSKKHGSSASLYHAGTNESSSTWASSNMARSSSNLGVQSRIPEEQAAGKGKQPVQDFAGFNPLSEPTSTLNSRDRGGRASTSPSPPVTSSSATEDPQRHLEESRANLHPTSPTPIQTPARGPHLRQLSNASSAASSFVDSAPGSFRGDSYNHSLNASGLDVTGGAQQEGSAVSAPRSGTPPLMEPMFNFRSLAAMIGEETDKPGEAEHIEHIPAEDEVKEPSPTGSPRLSPVGETTARIRAGSPDSSGTAATAAAANTGSNAVSSPPADGEKENVQPDTTASQVMHEPKAKDLGEVSIMDHGQTAG